MTDESQSRDAGVVEVYHESVTDTATGGDTDKQARAVASIPAEERGIAWVSMEVYARQQARLCELEERVKALENKLDSAIMRERETAEAFKRGFMDVVGTYGKQFGWKTKT